MSYKSPIEIIYGDMTHKLENEVFTVIQNIGINIDKDELIKALQYDRNQYETGYADAMINAVPVVHGQWTEQTIHFEENSEDGSDNHEWQSARCSVCKQYLTTPYMYYFTHYNYCPNCGADMRVSE